MYSDTVVLIVAVVVIGFGYLMYSLGYEAAEKDSGVYYHKMLDYMGAPKPAYTLTPEEDDLYQAINDLRPD